MKGRSRIRFSLELQPTEGSPRFSQVTYGNVQFIPILFLFCNVVWGAPRLSKILQGSPADAQFAEARQGSLRFAGSPGEDSSRF